MDLYVCVCVCMCVCVHACVYYKSCTFQDFEAFVTAKKCDNVVEISSNIITLIQLL